MSPEIAIERVRSFLKWSDEKLERLDALASGDRQLLGWRRGTEYWTPSATWHEIFENDEDAALIGAQALRDNGLPRTQTGPSLQCNVKIRKEVRRCYCVSEKILTWKPQVTSRGSEDYNPAHQAPCLIA